MRRKEDEAYNKYTEYEILELMVKENLWEGYPDELEQEADVEAMNLRVHPRVE